MALRLLDATGIAFTDFVADNQVVSEIEFTYIGAPRRIPGRAGSARRLVQVASRFESSLAGARSLSHLQRPRFERPDISSSCTPSISIHKTPNLHPRLRRSLARFGCHRPLSRCSVSAGLPEIVLINPEETASLQIALEPAGGCMPTVETSPLFESNPIEEQAGAPGTFVPFDLAPLFPTDAPPLLYFVQCVNDDGFLEPFIFRGQSRFSFVRRVFDPSGALLSVFYNEGI